jgi:hypothetical protein
MALLPGKLAAVTLFRSTEGLFEDQLANSHSGTQANGYWSLIYDLPLNLPAEARVHGRRPDMDAKPESSEGTFSFNAGC